ncbi:MAG: cytochrome P450 [Gammaproteobacteria bacterium]|nr:cytochrome P450 [Gammaproteobacteria bacterium]NIR83180.1 cytochrome P450 [Gammaproteobacteria bacterium]NIR90988.1 cytochrome P450 [Gammaproteobacteria bacterium]NIU04345.1 cytochrome P450 [Gammaproteobacteria bacterium]NIV52568.1 cytochrome P450 [Gammaproteobacteria bacterium]
MRLCPPAWGIGREAKQDIDLDRYVIPRGTQIFLAQWVTHRDPRLFADPQRFEPERFDRVARRRIPRYAYFSFGGGPRICIGARFAMLETVLLLAAIMRHFRIELAPGHPVELQPAVTLRPRHGIRARVYARRVM